MGALATWIGRWFWLLLYLGLGLGLVVPGDWRGLQALLPWSLGVILFLTCLRVDLGSVASELRGYDSALRLLVATLLVLAVTPAVIGLLAPWWLPPDAVAGAVLVAAMPAGVSSAALAATQGGNVSLALVVILVSSLISPLSVPWLLQAVGGDPAAGTGVSLIRQAGLISVILLVPFSLAQVVRRTLPRLVRQVAPWCGSIAILLLASMVMVATAATRAAWGAAGVTGVLGVLAATVIITVLSLVLVVGLAHGWPSVWSRERVLALGCNAMYMNNGLAIAFAVTLFPDRPGIVLPGLVMQIPMVAGVALLPRLLPHNASAALDGGAPE